MGVLIVLSGVNNPMGLKPKRVQEIVSQWFSDRKYNSVLFIENTSPDIDPNEDYQIEYEVRFETNSLSRMCIEIWVTNDGYIAIGIERRERVAKRFDVSCRKNGFVTGHEPLLVNEHALLVLLDLVATGNMGLIVCVIPFIGLINGKAVFSPKNIDYLVKTGYSVGKWINVGKAKSLLNHNYYLAFEPWV